MEIGNHRDLPKSYVVLRGLLLAVGLVLAGYLLYHHYEVRLGPDKRSFCSLSDEVNCDVVALHPSSELLGIPLGVYGLACYLLLLWLLRRRLAVGLEKSLAWGQLLSWLSLFISLYLLTMSKWVIGSLCLVCSATYLINMALALMSFFPGALRSPLGSFSRVLADLRVR
jgi:uncharacterized membrane protein